MGNSSFKKMCLILLFAVIALAACSVPFVYESPSLFYKTGLDKTMLRVGKIAGIIAALLLMVQLIYISRIPWFENIIARRQAFGLHRKSGLIILTAAWGHAVLILGADHFVFFPFESKYWPEFTGVGLLILVTGSILLSLWQKKTGLSYLTWRRVHMGAALGIFVLVPVHVVNVSRSFESGPPLWGMVAMLGASVIMLIFRIVRK